jgi:hypothetical protein
MTALPDPQPPGRDACLFAEHEGAPREEAVLWPFWRITSWARGGVEFGGDAAGRIWLVGETDRMRAELAFTSNRGDGAIVLEPAAGGWLRIEVVREGVVLFRAWLDQPYEELEFWPDGADGEGEAPGRISKRGAWLQLRTGAFPGVPGDAHGVFSVEEVG